MRINWIVLLSFSLLCHVVMSTSASAQGLGCNIANPTYEYNVSGTTVPPGGGKICENPHRDCKRYWTCNGQCEVEICFIATEYDIKTCGDCSGTAGNFPCGHQTECFSEIRSSPGAGQSGAAKECPISGMPACTCPTYQAEIDAIKQSFANGNWVRTSVRSYRCVCDENGAHCVVTNSKPNL